MRRRRTLALASTVVSAAISCAPSPPAALPPGSAALPSNPGSPSAAVTAARSASKNDPPPHRVGPTRATLEKLKAIDWTILPEASPVDLATSADGASFEIVGRDVTSKTCSAGLVGAFKVGFFVEGIDRRSAVFRLGDSVLPRRDLVTNRLDDGAGTLTSNMAAMRSPSATQIAPGDGLHAVWIAIDERARSDTSVDVERFEGSFAPSTLRGHATRAFAARAVAVLPSTLYAFRRCETGCDAPLDSPTRVEDVELVGPPPLWLGTTGATQPQLVGTNEAFSDVSARVEPGSSASLSIVTTDEAIAQFRKEPWSSQKVPTIVTFSIEIVWPRTGDAEIDLFSGRIKGNPADVPAATYTPGGSDPDCVPRGTTLPQ